MCLRPGTVLTTHYFLHNLRIGPKNSSFWPWQYSSAQGNLTLQLIGSIHKLWRKRSTVNMTPGAKPMAKFTLFLSSTISLLHIIFPGCWNGPSYKKIVRKFNLKFIYRVSSQNIFMNRPNKERCLTPSSLYILFYNFQLLLSWVISWPYPQILD